MEACLWAWAEGDRPLGGPVKPLGAIGVWLCLPDSWGPTTVETMGYPPGSKGIPLTYTFLN